VWNILLKGLVAILPVTLTLYLVFWLALRFLFATRPVVMGRVLGIVYRHAGYPPDQEGRAHTPERSCRRGYAHPAFWQRAKSQYPFSHAVARRRVYRRA
jgi:hypothetical protein